MPLIGVPERSDQQNGAVTKEVDPCTIERQELRITKARRLASVKGRCLLSQVVREVRSGRQ